MQINTQTTAVLPGAEAELQRFGGLLKEWGPVGDYIGNYIMTMMVLCLAVYVI